MEAFGQKGVREGLVHLCNLSSAEVGKPLQRESQHIRRPVNREALGRRHLLFAPADKEKKCSHNTSTTMDFYLQINAM